MADKQSKPKTKRVKTERVAKISHALFTDLMPSTLPGQFNGAGDADADSDGDAGAPVPTTVQLLPPSGFTGRDGRGPYTYNSDDLLASFGKNGMDLPIDFEHQSLGAMEKIGPTPACGWIKKLIPQEDGLFAEVEWNDDAQGLISTRAYRYLSPVFEVDTKKPEQIAGMLGAGLTNNPNLHLAAFNSRGDGDYTKSTETPGKAMLNKILEALGLKADADESSVLSHISTITASATAAAALATELGAPEGSDVPTLIAAAHSRITIDPTKYVATGDFEAMSKRATDAEAALTTIKAEAHTKAVTTAVDGAIKAGKFTPATREQYLAFANSDLAAFEKLVAATPVLAVASQDPAVTSAEAAGVPAEAAALNLTADDVAHCHRFTISYKAHAKTKAQKA